MKITISIECEKEDEAHEVINLLTRRHKTWVEFKADSENGKRSERVEDSAPASSASKEAARANINPGDPTISKMGSATVDVINDILRKGSQPPLPKYEQQLKLMWSRGQVKFDGTHYYL